MTKTIIYHHNDEDGWASAAIIIKLFPDAELVACYHKNKYEFVEDYDNVFVVDFTFSSEEMNQLKNTNKRFVWIDHHISAMQNVQGEFEGVRREGTSACKLCWEYFFPNESTPQIIDFINGLDIWDFSKKGTKEFISFLESELELENEVKQILEMMNNFGDEEYSQAISLGTQINKFKEKITAKQEIRGVKKDFQGFKAKVFFSNSNNSHLGNEALMKNTDIDIAVMIDFVIINNEAKYKYSLRSREVDVAELAKRFGGGGHPRAAGFESDEQLW
jgi:uncharacterized protein